MQKFGFNDDGTIEEFRRRVQSRPGPVHIEYGSAEMYVAMAAALWFAVEHYEDHVSADMKDDSDVEGRLALHNMAHDMQDCLVQMFSNIGMELVDTPSSCSKESIKELREYLRHSHPVNTLIENLKDLSNKIKQMEPESDPEIRVYEVDKSGITDVTDEMMSTEEAKPVEVAQNGQVD